MTGNLFLLPLLRGIFLHRRVFLPARSIWPSYLLTRSSLRFLRMPLPSHSLSGQVSSATFRPRPRLEPPPRPGRRDGWGRAPGPRTGTPDPPPASAPQAFPTDQPVIVISSSGPFKPFSRPLENFGGEVPPLFFVPRLLLLPRLPGPGRV